MPRRLDRAEPGSTGADEVARPLETRDAKTPRITLVCDNLNTHTMGAFYERASTRGGRKHVKRIDFAYTPGHGNLLNVAECELSCLTRGCLSDRRIPDIETLQTEIAAWAAKTDLRQRAVDRQ